MEAQPNYYAWIGDISSPSHGHVPRQNEQQSQESSGRRPEYLEHGIPSKPLIKLPSKLEIPMARALKGLLDGGIPVMEYGEQIAARYGNADAPMQVEWVIPDNEIHRASQILLAHGLPISKTDPWPHFGVWDKKPTHHELSSELGICIYLIPMRIVKLGLEDTIEVFSWCSDELKIRSPIPGRYMMSLIRLLRLMKLDSSSRHRPEKDLKDFVSFAIFGKRDKGIIPAIQYSEYERGAREMRKKIIADIVVDGWDFGQVDAAELELVRNVIWDPLAVRRLFDVSQKVVDL